ncbi:MAG: FAD-dependent oxidoreductase [Candidatus Coatesbacteria bacterium]|nr:MAG: FAD-dependent oxidoreductase [Candidatus Coatesbacteria bacterium]
MKITSTKDLDKLKSQGREALYPGKIRINVGSPTCGVAKGALEVLLDLLDRVQAEGLEAEVAGTGCLGYCEVEPLVDVWVPGEPRVIYANVTVEDTPALVEALKEGRVLTDKALFRLEGEYLFLGDEEIKYQIGSTNGKYDGIPLMAEVPFYGGQYKLVTRNCGYLTPTALPEYVARGGLYPLVKALTQMTPEEVIAEVSKAGLRGRGGAGFPTGRKWQFVREAPGDVKYIICNAEEGDPGAYMDRSVVEGDPYSVLESMIVCAYVIGNCKEGYVYIKHEYERPRGIITTAVETLREYGLLGDNILGTGLDFDIHVARDPGAFVCGEETALINAIEGKRGEARLRPPYPAQKGLFDKPTVVNNVETWANVPVILDRGGEWYSALGTEGSKGTKVVSLAGKVSNTGLVEVPMGTKLWDVIFGMGGGVPTDRGFKGVQIGSPLGGCVPGELLDLPLDYEKLTEAGAMVGSGGMIVMDEHTCMVDMAKFFMEFNRDESCGRCTPCRDGVPAALAILDRITKGEGTLEDLDTLEELGTVIQETSLCGLGQTAPNPVLATLRYFRDEYEAHIVEKRCPGAVCKALISAPCHHVCPIGMDPPSYIGYIAQGEFNKAYEVIAEASPFPGVCGRVCDYPCEFKCTSGDSAQPIAVRALKRFVADYAKNKNGRPKKKAAGKFDEKVAVIGSGPAGLTCAYQLALRGYAVTVFEALPVAGGMLAVGIPAYRLPRDILEFEIENVKRAGVEIETNTAVGKDVTLEELRARGYKAFFVATGAHTGLKLGLDGEDAAGVVDAVAFLRDVNLGQSQKPGDRVGVVGGGNAAVDAARTALRLGAAEVHILYRRTKQEMPAQREEIEAAQAEGIHFHLLVAPKRVLVEGGRMVGLECLRMELGEVDASGRRRPVPIDGSEFTLELDALIPAISQEPDLTCLAGSNTVETTERNTVVADEKTLQTAAPDVFAGGDVVTGPWTVTGAMGHGKLAAEMIHKYLRGEALEPEYAPTRPTADAPIYQLTEEEVGTITRRPEVPCSSAPARTSNFDEVDLCLTDEQAKNEAKRCLRCDASST